MSDRDDTEALETEIEVAANTIGRLVTERDEARAEADRLRAENDRLRGDIEAVGQMCTWQGTDGLWYWEASASNTFRGGFSTRDEAVREFVRWCRSPDFP